MASPAASIPTPHTVFPLGSRRVVLVNAPLEDVAADIIVVPCKADGVSGGSVFEMVCHRAGPGLLSELKALPNEASQWRPEEKGKTVRIRPSEAKKLKPHKYPVKEIIVAGRPNTEMKYYPYHATSHQSVVQRIFRFAFSSAGVDSVVLPAIGCGSSLASHAAKETEERQTQIARGVAELMLLVFATAETVVSIVYVAIPKKVVWTLWCDAFHSLISTTSARREALGTVLSTFVKEPPHARIEALAEWQASQDAQAAKVVRETITFPGARIIVLDNFISQDECKKLTSQAQTAGLLPVDWEYSPEYRSCKRVVVDSIELASMLWKRLLPLLQREDLVGMRPFGFDNQGVWRPITVNSCCRFMAYENGDHFSPHRDGAFVETNEIRSVYTLMTYLNDGDFKGGETRFYEMPDGSTIKSSHTVLPKCGRTILFNHDVWHEGTKVISGTKHIFRTDIMFLRVDKIELSDRLRWRNDEGLAEAEALYQDSIRLQKEGDPAGSTKAYLAALDLQAKLPSVQTSAEAPENDAYNDDIFLHIFEHLGHRDLVKVSSVCRRWYRLSRDNVLWYKLYRRQWPLFGLAVKLKIPRSVRLAIQAEESADVISDWFTLYKFRVCADDNLHSFCVDIQGATTYSAAIGLNVAKRPVNHEVDTYYEVIPSSREYILDVVYNMPSKIKKVSGHYWMAESGHKNYLVGHEINSPRYGNEPVEVPFTKAKDLHSPPNVSWHVLEEITSWTMAFAFQKYLSSDKHPVVFSVPNWFTPAQVDEMEARILTASISTNYYWHRQLGLGAPYTCVRYSAELCLFAAGKLSGVVIDAGEIVTTVVAVWKGSLLPDTLRLVAIGSMDLNGIQDTPGEVMDVFVSTERLPQAVAECIKSAPREYQDVLSAEVLPVGAYAHHIDKSFEYAVGKLGVKIVVHSALGADAALHGAMMVASIPAPRSQHFKSRDDLALAWSLKKNKEGIVLRDDLHIAPHPLLHEY